jgi:hypothetical protein
MTSSLHGNEIRGVNDPDLGTLVSVTVVLPLMGDRKEPGGLDHQIPPLWFAGA